MSVDLLPLNHACLLVLCFFICYTCWYCVSLPAVSAGVVPNYRPCLLVMGLTISRTCGVVPHKSAFPLSWYLISAISAGVVPPCRPCLLVWCLTIVHACWYGTLLSAMPVVVVPRYRSWLLARYLTIGHACWSVATETNILQVECRSKNDGYKSDTIYTEVSLHQTCLLGWYYSQICLLVQCFSIRQGIWSVTKPRDKPIDKVPLPRVCEACPVPFMTPS